VESAAIVAAVLMGVVGMFQLALASGAPLGSMAWGGAHVGVLPTRLRIASAFTGLVVYPILILLVLRAGRVTTVGWDTGNPGMWALTALFGLGTLANLASRSRAERWWAVMSFAIAVCCAIVAIG
jgi:hypothetical protein